MTHLGHNMPIRVTKVRQNPEKAPPHHLSSRAKTHNFMLFNIY